MEHKLYYYVYSTIVFKDSKESLLDVLKKYGSETPKYEISKSCYRAEEPETHHPIGLSRKSGEGLRDFANDIFRDLCGRRSNMVSWSDLLERKVVIYECCDEPGFIEDTYVIMYELNFDYKPDLREHKISYLQPMFTLKRTWLDCLGSANLTPSWNILYPEIVDKIKNCDQFDYDNHKIKINREDKTVVVSDRNKTYKFKLSPVAKEIEIVNGVVTPKICGHHWEIVEYKNWINRIGRKRISFGNGSYKIRQIKTNLNFIYFLQKCNSSGDVVGKIYVGEMNCENINECIEHMLNYGEDFEFKNRKLVVFPDEHKNKILAEFDRFRSDGYTSHW